VVAQDAGGAVGTRGSSEAGHGARDPRQKTHADQGAQGRFFVYLGRFADSGREQASGWFVELPCWRAFRKALS